MKNITTIERIAMQKTAMQKKAILRQTAKTFLSKLCCFLCKGLL